MRKREGAREIEREGDIERVCWYRRKGFIWHFKCLVWIKITYKCISKQNMIKVHTNLKKKMFASRMVETKIKYIKIIYFWKKKNSNEDIYLYIIWDAIYGNYIDQV